MGDQIHIGLLAPQSASEPHFANFRKLLPADIVLTIEGRSAAHIPRYQFAGKTAEFVQRAVDFVRAHRVQGLIIAGAPVTLLNPDLEARVSDAVLIPTVTALSSATATLKALSAHRLIVLTPFDAGMNERIAAFLGRNQLTVLCSPLFENQNLGAAAGVGPDELFQYVQKLLTEHSTAQAIYFQGAALDPLPVIERLENRLGISVVASNPAMLWHLLSKMGQTRSIKGYGRLLSSWPSLSSGNSIPNRST
ncbi:MAG: hypothetical protein ACREQW_24935 [Candidatus Binatia bacterium]